MKGFIVIGIDFTENEELILDFSNTPTIIKYAVRKMCESNRANWPAFLIFRVSKDKIFKKGRLIDDKGFNMDSFLNTSIGELCQSEPEELKTDPDKLQDSKNGGAVSETVDNGEDKTEVKPSKPIKKRGPRGSNTGKVCKCGKTPVVARGLCKVCYNRERNRKIAAEKKKNHGIGKGKNRKNKNVKKVSLR